MYVRLTNKDGFTVEHEAIMVEMASGEEDVKNEIKVYEEVSVGKATAFVTIPKNPDVLVKFKEVE